MEGWMIGFAILVLLVLVAGTVFLVLRRLQWMEHQLETVSTRNESSTPVRTSASEAFSTSSPAALSPTGSDENKRLRQRLRVLLKREQRLQAQKGKLEREQAELLSRLSAVASLTPGQAREMLLEETRRKILEETQSLRSEALLRSRQEVEQEARTKLITAMQRLASQPGTEHSSTLVPLPNEEMKGRLIGKDGRNIHSFENATGTTLLIDDTPGMVLVSAFDPIRREIAAHALEDLIRDGRIHPSRIEEAVEESRLEIGKAIADLGERAIQRLRLSQIHPELIATLGKLHYRSSNNQNTLDHSIEVASLCSLIAAEVGLDPNVAKRAGLFHDIGKALDEENEGSHAIAGANLLRRLGEMPEVVNAVAASHEEVSAESPYAALVSMADSLSASRPGARADSSDGFVERIKVIESIGRDIDGVADCYAIQAGRELRIIVEPEKVDDNQAALIARDIRLRIENELSYPGSIRITVVRESRFEETAK